MQTLSDWENKMCKICDMCPLFYLKNKNYVPPEYKGEDAEVLLVGEAPGETEVKEKRPFVGKCGKLLRDAMNQLNIKYNVSNTVKCRPTTIDNQNRCPTMIEVASCYPFISQEVEAKQYKLVVLFGRVALNAFFPYKKISQTAGQILIKNNIKFLIMYHPSYILRNRNTEIEYDWITRLLNIKGDIL